jgi:release factor glutamine methyltransferase
VSEDRTWTVLDLLRWTSERFAALGIATPRLDAECLLAFALDTDRLRLYLDFDKPVAPSERERFRGLVRERSQRRVPVAQLTGRREFWSLPLRITRDVLIPRPETETVVEVALAALPDTEQEVRVLDVGTGSGALALALAQERPKARVVAVDVSEAALGLARENALGLGLADRVRFARGDLFEPVAGERFDLVVSNPPYLADGEVQGLAPELSHEPREALFAGPRGTELLERLCAEVPRALEPGGLFVTELAPDQAPAVQGWLARAGLGDVRAHPDLARRVRAVSARAPRGID